MLSNSFLSKWYGIGVILMIFMIALGGITRLTDSGLSMVNWNPVSGVIPPLNLSDWQNEFDNYKSYPEYQERNSDLTLSEFKLIFFWEYFHRMMGRLIGLFFIVPFIYFLFKKALPQVEIKNTLIIILLIILQGLLGWYMVQSGLDNAYVNHFRLMFHFMMAVLLISFTYWHYLRNIKLKINKPTISFNQSVVIFILVLMQIIFGTFTAGLEAGKIYNTFPMMNGSFFPVSIIFNDSMGIIENLFYNHAAVQYIHRLIGFSLLILSFKILFNNYQHKKLDTPDQILAILLVIQFLLGVITLITSVNIYFSVLHQVNASLIVLACIKTIYITKN